MIIDLFMDYPSLSADAMSRDTLSGGIGHIENTSFAKCRDISPALFRLSLLPASFSRIIYLLGVISCFTAAAAWTQILPFRTYDTKDGLPFGIVVKILQDRHGFLWFGTMGGGVTRFDGHTFTTFSTQTGLADNVVNGLCEDSKGNLWFGTRQGACRYDGRQLTTYTTGMGLANGNVRDILEDAEGNLWFATAGGVSKFDGETFTNFTTDAGLAHDDVRDIFKDADGNLWFGTFGGVSKFDGTKFISLLDGKVLQQCYVWCIFEDSKGTMWFGTSRKGVFQYDGDCVRKYEPVSALTGVSVCSILEDPDGDLWFGTTDGLVTRTREGKFFKYTTDHGLPDNNIRSILHDTEGNLWITTVGNGIARLSSDRVCTFTMSNGVPDGGIRYIQKDPAGRFFFSSWAGGIRQFDKDRFVAAIDDKGIQTSHIEAFLIDTRGVFWIGLTGGALHRYNHGKLIMFKLQDGTTIEGVSALKECRDGTLWIGATRGLIKFDGTSWTTYGADDGLANQVVQTIQEDDAGNLWIGGDNGISFFDGHQFSYFTTNDGLVNNWVTNIFLDNSNTAWISTWGGLSRFDGTTFTNYTAADGFPSNKCNFVLQDDLFYYVGTDRGVVRFESENGYLKASTASWITATLDHAVLCGLKDNQGQFWFGSESSVTRYVPPLQTVYPAAPRIHMKGVNINGTDHVIEKDFTCNYDMNNVSFRYVGLSYECPENVLYRYRLLGLDNEWNETRQRSVAYTRLPPGHYTFQLHARSNAGVWSAIPAALSFTIHPPFWETTMFRVGALGLLLLILANAHCMRTHMYKKRNLELEHAVQERTREISQQAEELTQTKQTLEQSHEVLEGLVEARTAESQKVIQELHAEVQERKKTETRLKSLTSQLAMVEERQRRNIAAVLHDRIGQNLIFAKRKLELQDQCDTGGNAASHDLLDILDQIIEDTRTLTLKLSPPELYDFGLEAAIEWYARKIQDEHGIAISFQSDRQPKPLEKDLQMLLFSAVRELLVNICKHANASSAGIVIELKNSDVRIVVSDNGKGFDVSPEHIQVGKNGGFGLFSIRERLGSMGGRMFIQTHKGQGTEIVLEAPIHVINKPAAGAHI